MFALMALLPWPINSAASRCAPVPQSKIRRSPLAVVSSTHEVLPPKKFVPGPGVAIDPLVPQKRTLMGPRLPCVSFPKDDPNHHVLYRLFIIARFCAPPFPDALVETSASVGNAKTTRLKIIDAQDGCQ